MSNIYTIEITEGITVVRFSAAPGLRELLGLIDEITGNYPYERRLWDFDAHGVDVGPDDVRQLAKYAKLKFVKPSRMAIVAPQDLVFGLSRLFEAHREDALVQTRVFRSEQEARVWLKGG
jgi:hypothetical protein